MDKKIIEMYKAGYSQKEICDQLEAQFNYVNKVLNDYGFNTHDYRHIPTFLKEIICYMIKEGYEQKEISEILDISIHVVRSVCSQNDLQGVAQSKRKKDNNDLIVKYYLEGKSMSEISKILHADKRRIKNVLIQAGVYVSRDVKDQMILDSYNNGDSYPDIVKNHNTGYRRIKRIIGKEIE